jgi:hypothetical protein
MVAPDFASTIHPPTLDARRVIAWGDPRRDSSSAVAYPRPSRWHDYPFT